MYQHQLTSFAYKFGLFSFSESDEEEGLSAGFTTAPYNETPTIFLSRVTSPQKLSKTQLKHLQLHYITIYDIQKSSPELRSINENVQIWYRCRVDKTMFHCSRYKRKNSTRLNHLACIEQELDANASYRHGIREEKMGKIEYYTYIQFFCTHNFRNAEHMLMYSSYRKTDTRCDSTTTLVRQSHWS